MDIPKGNCKEHCFEKIHPSLEPSVSMCTMQDSIRDFLLKYAG